MNIIHKVTWQCMKRNKRRTIVTLIGVLICTAMVTALLSIGISFQKGMVEATLQSKGSHEVIFSNLDESSVDSMMENRNVAEAMRIGELVIAKEEHTSNDMRPYITIVHMDIEHMGLRAFDLDKGKLPVKDHEVLIDSYLYEKDQKNYGVGKSITLPIGEFIADETGAQVFTETGRETFVITGIASGGSFRDEMSSGGTYLAYAPFQNSGDKKDMSLALRYKSGKDVYQETRTIADRFAIKEYQFNAMLLMASGTSDSSLLTTLIQMTIIIGLIIMIGGISFIYNAFSISLSERNRMLGMLASVGATRKQKRNSVLFEAFVIGIIAIPLGLLCGFVGINITFMFLNAMTQELVVDGFTFHLTIYWFSIVGTIVFTSFILLISAWIPARKAKGISCISSIRQNSDIQIRTKNVKTSSLTRIIFGFEGELGLKNMKRNRSRYLATLFSLITCIVLFLSANAFANSISATYGITKDNRDADLIVEISPKRQDEGERKIRAVSEETMKKIVKLPSASSLRYSMQGFLMTIAGETPFTKEAITILQEQAKRYGSIFNQDTEQIGITTIILDNEEFAAYAKQAGVDSSAFQTEEPTGILINQTTYIQEGDRYTVVPWVNMQAGDKLSFSTFKEHPNKNGEFAFVDLKNAVKLAAVTDQLTGFESNSIGSMGMMLVMNRTNFEILDATMQQQGLESMAQKSVLHYKSDYANQLQDEIKQQLEGETLIDYNVFNVQAHNRENQQMLLIVSTFLYGFVTLILLTCIANIMNTISTGIGLRRREFAMLKSVGITNKKFKKMICYESMFYGIKAAIYGIPLSLLCIYGMHTVLINSIGLAFQIPLISLLIAVVGVFVILFFTMLYAIRKVKNDNIVETIRNESI